MRYRSLYVFALILFAAAIPSEGMENCSTHLSIDPAVNSIGQCTSINDLSARSKCISDIFVNHKSKVSVRNDGSFMITLFKPFCISSIPINARSSGTLIHFSTDGRVSGITTFLGTVGVGNILFSEAVCGWAVDRSKTPKLAKDYAFIPSNARVKVASPGCRPDGTLNPGIVALVSRTTICSTPLNANTSFGYGADGHYHFTALNNGMMKDSDHSIKIVKGKDYRNANPAEYPCEWRETPADVLKSFAEEHSE